MRAKTGYVGICTGLELGTTATAAASLVKTIYNPFGGRAYLVIVAASEVGAATLNVEITAFPHNGPASITTKVIVSALTAAVTANGTYVYLLGSDVATGGPAAECMDFTLPRQFQIGIVVTGTTSSFVTSACLAFC